MKKNALLNITPALIGLGALSIYVLACTSFSPDDSKVLFDTVDAKTGATGVAVYDRKTAKTELLFQPLLQDTRNLETHPALLRPQWLDDGHSFLTAWLDGDDASLNIAILPFDRRATARSFQITNLTDDAAGMFYYRPLPVVDKFLFLMGQTNTHSIIRLDLATGEMRRQTNQHEMILLPYPANDRVFYLSINGDNGPSEFGLLDPITLTPTPRFHVEKGELSPWSLALSRDSKCLAYQLDNEKPPVIHLLESGKAPRTLSLASLGEKTEVNIRHFSLKGDLLYASFKNEGSDGDDYGFLEIPLDGASVRKTVLISKAPHGDKDMFLAFQIDLSHDGKTLAVESLWLAYSKPQIPAKDCALFLVDVSKPAHKITKVPIPLPPLNRPSPIGQ